MKNISSLLVLKSYTMRVVLFSLGSILLLGQLSNAAPVTYTFTALGVSGNIGNTGTSGSYSDAVTGGEAFSNAAMQIILEGDTADVTGSNGSASRLGTFESITGNRISFTLTGGGLASPVSGTMLGSDNWTFQSGTAPLGQGNYLFFVDVGQFLQISFMRPGPASSPVPTYDYMVTNQSFTVDSRLSPGSNSDQNPPPNYVGGTNFANWDTVTPSVWRVLGTSVGGLYITNGSNDYFNGSFGVAVVPEASSGLLLGAGLAALAFFRLRRK